MLLALLALTSIFSFRRLGNAPIYLGGDEAVFATHAASIAATGSDLSGKRFPLFIHVTDSPEANSVRWYQPTLFYLIAIVLKVAPLTEASVRFPIALIAILDIWLMYVVAARVLPTKQEALLASTVLALTPAHFMFGRQALDYLCPLPFVLGWLWCLTIWIQSPGGGDSRRSSQVSFSVSGFTATLRRG